MKIFDFEKDGTAYRMKQNVRTYSNGNLALAMHIHTKGGWVPTGKTARSCYCTYPQYKFRETALREIDLDGYERYLANFAA